MADSSITEIKLNYKPYDKQLQVHKLCNKVRHPQSSFDVDADSFFIIVVAGRQSGKTKLAVNQLTKWAIENPGTRCWWVCPAEKHVIEAYNTFLNGNGSAGLYGAGLVKSHRGSSGSFEIVLTNNTKIEFKTAGSSQNLRGSSIHYMVIDEAREIDRRILEEVLIPTMNVKGRKCLIATTPRGKSHWTYEYYNLGLKGNEQSTLPKSIMTRQTKNWTKFRSFHFTSADNPYSKKENIEMAKTILTPQAFEQEYMGKFVEKSTVFTNVNDISILESKTKNEYGVPTFAGIDIGLVSDASVITIMDIKYNVLHIERMVNITAPALKQRIKDITDQFSCRKVLIEANNQGRPIIDDLKDSFGLFQMYNIEEFETQTKSKELLISQLVNAFAEKRLKILRQDQTNGDVLLNELDSFGYDIDNNTGRITFKAMGSSNDDCVMSLALAMRCVSAHQYKGLTFA